MGVVRGGGSLYTCSDYLGKVTKSESRDYTHNKGLGK